jgi:hypothetical protein
VLTWVTVNRSQVICRAEKSTSTSAAAAATSPRPASAGRGRGEAAGEGACVVDPKCPQG